MSILLLGGNGQVGSELQASLASLGEVIALDRRGADGLCGDLESRQGIAATIRRVRPSIIVNAAAYTAVDLAETQRQAATAINALAPGAMAEAAAEVDALLVHFSSDYVFDGSGDRPWLETDAPSPLNHYGHTKLAGEQAITASGCRHLILRTSWVYGPRGNNFPRTILRLATERETLQVVADQTGSPTSARLIATITAQILPEVVADPGSDGIYHLTASGETTWHGCACQVIEQARRLGLELRVHHIEAVASGHFPSAARRPANSRLDTGKLRRRFGVDLPPWRDGVAALLKELTGTPP